MKWVLLFLFLLLLLAIIRFHNKKTKRKDPTKTLEKIAHQSKTTNHKKVIYLMIDSLIMKTMQQEIAANRLPALRFFTQHAQTVTEIVSSFPTMSVTIDSTLLTGTHPNQHGIFGLNWYREEEKRVVNYGTGANEAFHEGPNQVLQDALLHLNQNHLSHQVSTIYEELAQRGIPSGSINGMIYRGQTEHTLSFPTWLHLPTSLKEHLKVKSPDLFAFGTFANPFPEEEGIPEGILNSLGFADPYPIAITKKLIKQKLLPRFLFVYLSDLDKPIHKKGPEDTSGLQKLDKELASLLDSFGSWDKALEEIIWIISGDSGQTKILPEDQEPIIPLHSIFRNYKTLPAGKTASSETEIVICVNERMAYIYVLQPTLDLTELVSLVVEDSRIDLIAIEDGQWVEVRRGGTDKFLRFRPGEEWTDIYDQQWELQGDPYVLNLTLNQTKKEITYGDYPDALSRLAGVFHFHSSPLIVVTAKPGYQFADRYSPKHLGGGGHGSLHRSDSLAPLIILGTKRKPQYNRIIDLKSFIIDIVDGE